MTDLYDNLKATRQALKTIDSTLEDLSAYRDETARKIASWLRVGNSGLEIDPTAIQMTITKPYTLIPTSQNEALLIQWAGIKMPVLGYVIGRDGPFIKSRVSRSMDLITPFPQYIKDEMGWKEPAHKVTIDSTYTGVHLLEGEESTFRKKYGMFLGNKKSGTNSYAIRGGDAWIKLVSALIADGILPYMPKPVAPELWDPSAKMAPKLIEILEKLDWKKNRQYIARAVEEWKQTGAMLFNIPPSAGKSLIFYIILTHFKGRVLLFADTKPLVEKWRRDLQLLAPNANVIVSTYQGASKHKDSEWDLILFDEAHRLPADSFSKLAFFRTSYRAGATATAWREDKRQHLIVALCGKPFYIPWEELISAGILKKPHIYIAVCKNDQAKMAYVKKLVEKRNGKTLVFCDWINMGNEYAKLLDAPFVHGETKNQLEVIESSEVVVASKVADRGLSMQNLRLVIEVAFQGRSREQYGQRIGRLLHSDFFGSFYTVFTYEELQAYQSRIYGVELELAGEVDIEYIYVDTIKEPVTRETKPSRPASGPKARKPSSKPLDEIGTILAEPAISNKISQAEKPGWKIGYTYLSQIMRYVWGERLTPREIVDGLGLPGKNAERTLRAGANSLVEHGLLTVQNDGYFVNHPYLDRLRTIARSVRK